MRLIDADVLKDRLQSLAHYDWNQGASTTWANAYSECGDMVEEMPTIEPERKSGNWVGIDDEPCETFECDVCGFTLEDWIQGAFYNFCPNCGADMRGDE